MPTSTHSQTLRLMLVDDSPDFQKAAAAFLKRQPGLSLVAVADESETAVVKAQEHQPQVVLVDLNLPGQSGLELIPRLRSRLPKAAIIAVTLLDAALYREPALQAGADDFVTKADLMVDLLPAIQRTVRRYRSED